MTGGKDITWPMGHPRHDSDKDCERKIERWGGCPPACRCEAAKLKYVEAVQGADTSWKPPAAAAVAATVSSTSCRAGGEGGGDDGDEGRGGGGGSAPQKSSSGMGPVFSSFAYDEAGDDQVCGRDGSTRSAESTRSPESFR